MLARDDMSCRGIMRQMKVVLGLHDRRSGRFAGIPRGDRGRPGLQDPRAADLPARPGPGDRRAGDLQSLCRSFGRGEPASISATPFPASSTPCGSGTISSTRPAAGFPTTGWRPSTPWKARPWKRPAFSPGSAAATGLRRRRSPTSARPCSMKWPSGTTSAAGRSSSISVRCGTTIRGCFSKLAPTPASIRLPTAAYARGLSRFLDRLDRTNQLAKTILYNLNPAQNEVLGTMIGNFQDGSVPGKMQFGSGWWFLDQKDGMEKQINCLSNLGLLSCFVGMLTDSRSFLSYTRHEYFRRILCNLLGDRDAAGPLAGRHGVGRRDGPRHLLLQRGAVFRVSPAR